MIFILWKSHRYTLLFNKIPNIIYININYIGLMKLVIHSVSYNFTKKIKIKGYIC